MREGLGKIHRRLRRAIAPDLHYSQYSYEEMLNSHVAEGMAWLDLGCGQTIIPSWRSREEEELVRKCKRVVGLDYDYESLKKHEQIDDKVRGDIGSLPFKDGTFDIATANMVVENLDNPEIQFKEVTGY